MAALSGFFGQLAMVIAAIGLYGLVSYVVSTRYHELGTRRARRDARDVRTIAAGVLMLAVVAIGAALIPARRAASVDPIVALRVD